MPAIRFTNDAGEEKLWPAEHAQELIDRGWRPVSGQTMGVETEVGRKYMPVEQALSGMGPSNEFATQMVPASSESAVQDWEYELEKQKYGDSPVAATALGVARGLTGGLSDVILSEGGIVDRSTLSGIKEHNRGWSTVGEVGSILGGGVGALGRGAAANVLSKTPTGAVSKWASTRGIKGAAAEGFAQGIGMTMSDLALSDTPHAPEAAARELLLGGVYGGLIGGAGYGAFKLGGKLSSKVRRPKQPKHLDITTPEGEQYLGSMSNRIQETLDMGDDAFVKTDPVARRRITPDELEQFKEHYTRVNDYSTDAIARLSQRRTQLASEVYEIPGRPAGVKVEKPVYEAPELPARPIEPDAPPPRELTSEADLDEGLDAFFARARGDADEAVGGKFAAKPRGNKRALQDAVMERADSMEARKAYDKAWAKYEADVAKWEAKVANIEEKAQADYAKRLEKYESSVTPEAQAAEVKAYEERIEQIEKLIAARDGQVAIYDQQISRLSQLQDKASKIDWANPEQFAADLVRGRQTLIADKGVEEASDFAYELTRARRILGDSATAIADMKQTVNYDLIADIGRSLQKRLDAPVPEGLAAARNAFAEADKEAKALFGIPTAQTMSSLVNKEPEDIVKAFNALQRRANAAEAMAKASKETDVLEALRGHNKAVSQELLEALPEETVKSLSAVDVGAAFAAAGLTPSIDGPYDDVAKIAVLYSILRKGGKLPLQGVLGRGGKKLSSTIPGQIASAGAGGTARGLVNAPGPIGRGVRSATSMGAYRMFGKGLDAISSPEGIFRVAGSARSEVANAVGALSRKVAKAGLSGGTGAATILRAINLGEDKSPKADNLAELFAAKAEAIREMTYDRQRMKEMIWEQTKELRGVNPKFGDGAEVGVGRAYEYLADTMPKDPGGHRTFAKSIWMPDDYEIQAWANRAKGVLFPMEVVRGVKDGTITAEGAEALRQVWPDTFAQIQMAVAENMDAIAENLSYEEENRLSILLGVPVNDFNTPEYQTFITEMYSQRNKQQAEAMGKVDANALMSDQPTRAQQLLSRGK